MTHITFIHGMANKPKSDELLNSWKRALASAKNPIDIDAVATCRMVYWADVLYEKPLDIDGYESAKSDEIIAGVQGSEIQMPVSNSSVEQEWINSFRAKIGTNIDFESIEMGLDKDTMASELEGLVPNFISKAFLKIFLRDVHHYLFNAVSRPRPGEKYKVQDEIRSRFISALEEGEKKSGKHIVVSHSMGTVIAYDCLMRVKNCPKIDDFFTIGSPLGMSEIHDQLKPEWTRNNGYPSSKIGRVWKNFYDSLDVVSRIEPKLSNYFKRDGQEIIEDIRQSNTGKWRHDINKYLRGAEVSNAIARALGVEV